jgi:hypothetical protein
VIRPQRHRRFLKRFDKGAALRAGHEIAFSKPPIKM